MALLAHYKMNDNTANTTVTDSSGEGLDLTLNVNTDTRDVTGKINNALAPTTAADNATNSSSALDDIWAGGATISLWMKLSSYDDWDGGSWGIILAKADSTHGWYMVADGVHNKFAFVKRASTSGAQWSGEFNHPPEDDTWHHMVVTYDSDLSTNHPIIYYDDTVETISGDPDAYVGSVLSDSGLDFTLFNYTALGYTPKCALDDVRIYDSVLTAGEVSELYNGGDGTEAKLGAGDTIAHFKFNDDVASTLVVNENGPDGTLQNDNTADVSTTGKINETFTFNGTDNYIEVGNYTDFNFGDGTNDSAFSIACWCKTVADTTNQYVCSKHDWSDNSLKQWHFAFVGGPSGGSALCRLYDASTGGYIGRRYTNISITNENGWVHFVVTYNGGGDSSDIEIYRNTVAHTNADWASGSYTAMEATATTFKIGTVLDPSPSSFWSGNLDDLRIYDHVLDAYEIATIYNSSNGGEGNLATNMVGLGRSVTSSVSSC